MHFFICTRLKTTIPLRLCAFARGKIHRGGWGRRAKPPSRKVRRGGRQELQQLDARNPPRRAGLPAVGRQEPRSERLVKDLSIPLRLCAFARVKKKKIMRAKPQSRKVRRGGRQELQELDPRHPPRRAGLPAVGRQ